MKKLKEPIKVRKTDKIKTNTIIFESKIYKKDKHKKHWYDEMAIDDYKELGISYE